MNSQSSSDGRGRVLVVDDVTRNLQVVGTALREAGYEVIPATSGAQALERARAMPPDLVLLDLMMPGMDGLEACRRLKADPETAPVPVIFLTASDETRHLVEGFEAGASDYLTKPFSQPELLVRVRTHIELARARGRLRRMNDEKNEFMGILAHNLRTPLSTATWLAELAQEEASRLAPDAPGAAAGAPGRIAEYCAGIREAAGSMAEMITNLLDANRIDRGEMRPELVPSDLAPIVASVADTQQPRAAAKGQSIRLDAPAGTAFAAIDPHLVAQVVDNLVSNAVKYSPHGKRIDIRLGRRGDRVRIEVQDEGPGLGPEDLARMFGTFVRLTPQPTGGEHSTGLGLSIVRRIVELMDGRVWCESEPGHGATFLVEFAAVAGSA